MTVATILGGFLTALATVAGMIMSLLLVILIVAAMEAGGVRQFPDNFLGMARNMYRELFPKKEDLNTGDCGCVYVVMCILCCGKSYCQDRDGHESSWSKEFVKNCYKHHGRKREPWLPWWKT